MTPWNPITSVIICWHAEIFEKTDKSYTGVTHLNLCMCSWTNYYIFLLFLKMDSVNTCHCQCLCPHVWLFTCAVGVALSSPDWSLSASQPLIKPQYLSRCSPPLSLFAASLLLCSLICLFARLNSLQRLHSIGFSVTLAIYLAAP